MYGSSRKDETTVLLAEKVHAFHKFFYVDYKENQRGRFLKITEKDGRFRSTIIIPEEAVADFAKLLNSISQQYDPAGRTAEKRKEFEERRKEFQARRAERFANAENSDEITSFSDKNQDSMTSEIEPESKSDADSDNASDSSVNNEPTTF